MFGRGFNRHREQVSRGLESRSSRRLGVGARQVTDARRRGRPSAATSRLERNRAFRLVVGCYAAPNRETRVRISATLGPRALTSGIFASTGPWRTLVRCLTPGVIMKQYLAVFLGEPEAMNSFRNLPEAERKEREQRGMQAWMKWAQDN